VHLRGNPIHRVRFPTKLGCTPKAGGTVACGEAAQARARDGHLDERVVWIADKRTYLWRAVDPEGEVLDMLVQRRRDTRQGMPENAIDYDGPMDKSAPQHIAEEIGRLLDAACDPLRVAALRLSDRNQRENRLASSPSSRFDYRGYRAIMPEAAS
jgi:DDE domain